MTDQPGSQPTPREPSPLTKAWAWVGQWTDAEWEGVRPNTIVERIKPLMALLIKARTVSAGERREGREEGFAYLLEMAETSPRADFAAETVSLAIAVARTALDAASPEPPTEPANG